ncbi:MAG: bifunctional phosphopantothenoylcysteine decarboxylase/phosphopantothenate--cysteine ligase CoaBC [Calditrichota bacterium]
MKDNRPPAPHSKPNPELNNRRILLGVCGGIAAYKAIELCRLFVKAGARVQVVMTEAATKFVTPLTFETITARNVFVQMFPAHGEFSPWHTELATWPEIAVIAPATADHMAKLTAGLADDLLSTIMLTLERPRVLCPSMNYRMWQNPATQDNMATLRRRGYRFIMPDEGQMARPGEGEGIGRLAEPEAIFREIRHVLSTPQDLKGVRVLVTAGRTEESWDPVRVLTNRATGRMGFALAEEARERGAEVVLVHGPTDVIPPSGVRIRRVTTAAEMAGAVKQEFPQSRIVLMAAAVADYTFATTVEHKIKKGQPDADVKLISTEDILKSLSDKKGNRIVVGFALETENLLENALRKLREKHLDIVVANNPLVAGSGFAGETNQVLVIHRSGRVTELPLQSKREVAREILDAVIQLYRHPEPEPEPEMIEEIEEPDLPELDDLEIPAPAAEPSSVPQQSPNGKSGRRGGRRRGGRGRRDSAQRSLVEPAPSESLPELELEPATVPVTAPESMVEVAAGEIPATTAESAKKAGKTRRGGRRAARAKQRKQAMVAIESAEPVVINDSTPVPEPAAVAETAVSTTEAPTPAKKKSSTRKPRAAATHKKNSTGSTAKTPRKKNAGKKTAPKE